MGCGEGGKGCVGREGDVTRDLGMARQGKERYGKVW